MIELINEAKKITSNKLTGLTLFYDKENNLYFEAITKKIANINQIFESKESNDTLYFIPACYLNIDTNLLKRNDLASMYMMYSLFANSFTFLKENKRNTAEDYIYEKSGTKSYKKENKEVEFVTYKPICYRKNFSIDFIKNNLQYADIIEKIFKISDKDSHFYQFILFLFGRIERKDSYSKYKKFEVNEKIEDYLSEDVKKNAKKIFVDRYKVKFSKEKK